MELHFGEPSEIWVNGSHDIGMCNRAYGTQYTKNTDILALYYSTLPSIEILACKKL